MNKKGVISIRGCRENNLKNIDLDLPKNKLIVVTGVSGSGKSSLAFDTLYAEGQRRYMSSLSTHARMFLGQMKKPEVDKIEGLPPAIAISQKTLNHNHRSTVGTVTEIYDYLRLIYSRIGVVHCPNCGREVGRQSIGQIVDQIMNAAQGERILVLAPVIREKKGTHAKVLADARKNGFVRVSVDGEIHDLSEHISLDPNVSHSIEIVVDRLKVDEGIKTRLASSIECVFGITDGTLFIEIPGKKRITYSKTLSCPDCGISLEKLEPRHFSFNSPIGACPDCYGIGQRLRVSEALVIPDPSLSIAQGAIQALGWYSVNTSGKRNRGTLLRLSAAYHFDLDTPFNEYPEEIHDILIYGTDYCQKKYYGDASENHYPSEFNGILDCIQNSHLETGSDSHRAEYEALMTAEECPSCHGSRLRKEVQNVTFGGRTIGELISMPLGRLNEFFEHLTLPQWQSALIEELLSEIRSRLRYMLDVGLDYLTLGRSADTLSGGEAQRVRLAAQIGSGVVGVAYILDEPSIGLHSRDTEKLLGTLFGLRDIDNTVVVVEHDRDIIEAADYIVDIGPGAGVCGGEVLACGTLDEILASENSVTGCWLSGRTEMSSPESRREPAGFITFRGCRENNLKNITVDIPLGVLCCVTGVSGSGKSSLVHDIVYKELARKLNRSNCVPGKFDSSAGIENIDKVILIDQSPIGRNPRSNPATYTGVFDLIRDLFAQTIDAKTRGYKKDRFSFNTKAGCCEICGGDGSIKIDMHFLPDVYVECEACGGKRYNEAALQTQYKGKNIAEVLDMNIEEAYEFFRNIPNISTKLKALVDVGLTYMKLGQSATTLSGGEAQRVKLAAELGKVSTGKTMYILDEPTTGLHFQDITKLMEIFRRIVDEGNTVLVIEHNMDVISHADYIIDLGPEGGEEGGNIAAIGKPEDIIRSEKSYTGMYMKKYLKDTHKN